jgi:hypothetical protein
MKQANALEEQAFGDEKVEMEENDVEWEEKAMPAEEETHHHEEDLTHFATDATAGDDWHIPIVPEQPLVPVVLDRLVDIPGLNGLDAIPESTEAPVDGTPGTTSRIQSPYVNNTHSTEEGKNEM